jgi:hypothetical protein
MWCLHLEESIGFCRERSTIALVLGLTSHLQKALSHKCRTHCWLTKGTKGNQTWMNRTRSESGKQDTQDLGEPDAVLKIWWASVRSSA